MLDLLVLSQGDKEVVLKALKDKVKGPGNEVLPQRLLETVVSVCVQGLQEDREVPDFGVEDLRTKVRAAQNLLERVPVRAHYVPQPLVLQGV